MDSIFKASGSSVNKRSSSIFGPGPSDGDLARPPIITTDLGNGVFSFTAGIGNLTINNTSSPTRATTQRNTKTTPFSSPKRPGGQPSAELPKIGAIRVLQQSTENDLGTAHWTSIFADPTNAILSSSLVDHIVLNIIYRPQYFGSIIYRPQYYLSSSILFIVLNIIYRPQYYLSSSIKIIYRPQYFGSITLQKDLRKTNKTELEIQAINDVVLKIFAILKTTHPDTSSVDL